MCHNKIVGHGGVKRTVEKLLKLSIEWEHMTQHTHLFIQQCACCQKMNATRVPIHVHKYVTSAYKPFHVLNIDFIGPFPDSSYVLVIICTFTRWTDLFWCADNTAKSATDCLFQQFGRYGAPKMIRSDRGSHFANDLIKQFLVSTGTPHNLTLATAIQRSAIRQETQQESTFSSQERSEASTGVLIQETHHRVGFSSIPCWIPQSSCIGKEPSWTFSEPTHSHQDTLICRHWRWDFRRTPILPRRWIQQPYRSFQHGQIRTGQSRNHRGFSEFYFTQPFPRLREIRRNLYTILNSVETYNKFSGTIAGDYDGSSKDPLAGIVVAFQDLTSLANEPSEPKMSCLFVGFTWHSEVPYISRAVNTRGNVRTADKRLMRMIYKIGYGFLGADVIILETEGSQNSSYMNFNPTSDSFYRSDYEGFYQSNITSIERYFIAIRYIMEHPDIPWRSLRIICLAIIYDFMSFCAQLLLDAVYMQADILQTRSNVEHALKTYRANIVYVDQVIFHNAFHNAFSAIISCIKPVPSIPNRFVKQTSPIKTSYSRMSAIDREEQLSETTNHTQADGDDEESNDSYSNDESSSDEDMTPPSSSSAHHRRCNESLALGNPFVMGHKRSLLSLIQSDTKHPARKRVSRPHPFQDEYEEETPDTSSSKDAPQFTLQSKTNFVVPHLPSPAMVQPPTTDAVQVQIKDEPQQMMCLDQPSKKCNHHCKMSCIPLCKT